MSTKKYLFRTLGVAFAIVALFVAIPNKTMAANMMPKAYTVAVEKLHNNTFGENNIRSFVYNIFAMYDYHVPVNQFYPYLVNQDLEMQFPEGKLTSHQDFEHWYDVSVGENITSNTHTLESLQVAVLGNKTYQVDLVVWWQAENTKGEYLSYHFKQKWILVEEHNSLKIQKYIVKKLGGK